MVNIDDELSRIGRFFRQEQENRIADYLPRYGEKVGPSTTFTTQSEDFKRKDPRAVLDQIAKLQAMLPPAPHDSLYLTEATRTKLIAKVEPGMFNHLFPSRFGGMTLCVHPAGTLLRNKKTGSIMGIIGEDAVYAGYRHEIEVVEP